MSEEHTIPEAEPNNRPAGIESLLSNPELLRTLGSLIGNFSKPKATEEAAPASAAVPSADGLSALLSNPEMMEKLPGMIATLAPVMSGLQSPARTETEKNAPAHANRAGCRDQLLLSLKPFLSQKRCDAIDTMLRIAALSQVLGQMK